MGGVTKMGVESHQSGRCKVGDAIQLGVLKKEVISEWAL